MEFVRLNSHTCNTRPCHHANVLLVRFGVIRFDDFFSFLFRVFARFYGAYDLTRRAESNNQMDHSCECNSDQWRLHLKTHVMALTAFRQS